MSESITFNHNGNLGNIAGLGGDGVLVGQIALANPSAVYMQTTKDSGLCVTDDGGLYVDESATWAEATGDDVEVLPATPAAEDAAYFGHATATFAKISANITTAAVDLVATIAWEYWNGTAWTALTGLTDGTTGWTATTGFKDVTFTEPTDWAKCTVDGINAYWIRSRVSAFTSITTAPQVGQGYITPTGGVYVDDTTDFTDAGADDVDGLPIVPTVGDGLVIGYGEKFCKIKVTTGQARTGTATLALKYWDGSAWTAVTTVDDDSVGYSATAGTHWIHFTPPSDWVPTTAANGPGGTVGYFVKMELTALTSVTQQPLITQGWVCPLKTGAEGVPVKEKGTITRVDMQAGTLSGSTADSKFILVNTTTQTVAEFTWTKADAKDSAVVSLAFNINEELMIVQIIEDGTTEFADATFIVSM